MPQSKKTIQRLFGDDPRSTLGTGWTQSSGHIRGARAAGVKIDMPLTPAEIEAQKIADELAAESRIADSRSAFEKKYDIRHGRAHVTPDGFQDLLTTSKMSELRRAGVLIVEIEGIGVKATFELGTSPEEDVEAAETRHIRLYGISGTLKGRAQVALVGNKTYHGILRAGSIPAELDAHARADRPGITYTNKAEASLGNYAEVFRSPTTLAYYALSSPQTGGMDIIRPYWNQDKNDLSLFHLGCLHSIQSIPGYLETPFERVPFKIFKRRVDHAFHGPRETWLASVFGNAAGLIINHGNRPASAILLPPGSPAPSL